MQRHSGSNGSGGGGGLEKNAGACPQLLNTGALKGARLGKGRDATSRNVAPALKWNVAKNPQEMANGVKDWNRPRKEE